MIKYVFFLITNLAIKQTFYVQGLIISLLFLQETGDVRFVAEGNVIHAHRAVLKIRSEYFRKLFDNHWKESMETE